ncbi:MAG: hypothetical protein Q9169_004558 [Polycauliona sp. 2 TL-2023]
MALPLMTAPKILTKDPIADVKGNIKGLPGFSSLINRYSPPTTTSNRPSIRPPAFASLPYLGSSSHASQPFLEIDHPVPPSQPLPPQEQILRAYRTSHPPGTPPPFFCWPNNPDGPSYNNSWEGDLVEYIPFEKQKHNRIDLIIKLWDKHFYYHTCKQGWIVDLDEYEDGKMRWFKCKEPGSGRVANIDNYKEIKKRTMSFDDNVGGDD